MSHLTPLESAVIDALVLQVWYSSFARTAPHGFEQISVLSGLIRHLDEHAL
jgi:hypothetical protein